MAPNSAQIHLLSIRVIGLPVAPGTEIELATLRTSWVRLGFCRSFQASGKNLHIQFGAFRMAFHTATPQQLNTLYFVFSTSELDRPPVQAAAVVGVFSNLFALCRGGNPLVALHPCRYQPARHLSAGELSSVIGKKEALPKSENADCFGCGSQIIERRQGGSKIFDLVLEDLHAVIHVAGARHEEEPAVNRKRVAG